MTDEVTIELVKPWFVDYDSMTEKELHEYFQDIQADEVINEQKEQVYCDEP